MSELKPCLFGNERCLCKTCKSNAFYPDCNSGYCIECFECEKAGKAVHDIFICTGHKERAVEHEHTD